MAVEYEFHVALIVYNDMGQILLEPRIKKDNSTLWYPPGGMVDITKPLDYEVNKLMNRLSLDANPPDYIRSAPYIDTDKHINGLYMLCDFKKGGKIPTLNKWYRLLDILDMQKKGMTMSCLYENIKALID